MRKCLVCGVRVEDDGFEMKGVFSKKMHYCCRKCSPRFESFVKDYEYNYGEMEEVIENE